MGDRALQLHLSGKLPMRHGDVYWFDMKTLAPTKEAVCGGPAARERCDRAPVPLPDLTLPSRGGCA